MAVYYKMPVEKIHPHFSLLMNRLDSSNLFFIEQVISGYGYPGKSIVGEETNEVAWYVIQHSEKIAVYFPIIEEAGKKKEIAFARVATMEDRLLVEQKKEQKYGTQITRRKLKNEKEESIFVWPIKDPDTVNERRKVAGIELTIEEYAKRFGITYKKVKLSDIEHIN